MWVSEEWRAMGSTARVWFAGPRGDDAVREARHRIDELEGRWSRFRPDSDISRLNAAEGETIPVHPDTLEALIAARTWWEATGGRFDPTVLAALHAAGYDRDRAEGVGQIRRGGAPVPGPWSFELDPDEGTARLPAGVGVDLGGIGKGRAADVVADALSDLPGGLVDLGGDLRAWGTPPSGEGWAIGVEDVRDGSQLAILWLGEGAAATSTTLRRRWSQGTVDAHHLIDPRTGLPCDGEVVQVTAVAGRAEAAEVLAKAAIVDGTVAGAAAVLDDHRVAGFVVPRVGPTTEVGNVRALCWDRYVGAG